MTVQPPSLMQPFLLAVLNARLAEAGISRADLARQMGVAESTIKRRLEGSLPTRGGGLDRLVEHVAALVERPAIDLWTAALASWESDPTGERLLHGTSRSRPSMARGQSRKG